MKKSRLRMISLVGLLFPFVFWFGCGYTQKVVMPNNIKTIAVPTFADEIPTKERYAYRPGLEIELTNAIRDRFIFDGNLKVVDEKDADAVLKGGIISYNQEALRYDRLESVQEYRLYLVVRFKLIDRKTDKVIIEESSFSGRTEYYPTLSTTDSSRITANSAVTDLARNIVDRIVEDW